LHRYALAPPPGEEEASQAVEAYIHMKEEAHTGEVEHVNSWQVETHTKDEIELFGVGPNGEVADEAAAAEVAGVGGGGEGAGEAGEAAAGEAAAGAAGKAAGEAGATSEEGGGGEGGDAGTVAVAGVEGAPAPAAAGEAGEDLPGAKRWCVPEMCKKCGDVCKSFTRSAMNEASVLPLRGIHANQTGVLLGTGASLDRYVHSDFDDDGQPVVTASIKSIIYTALPVDYVVFSDRAGPKGYDKNFRKIDAYKARKEKFYLHFASQKTFAPGSNPKWCRRGGGC
jgi:hypothetical protein